MGNIFERNRRNQIWLPPPKATSGRNYYFPSDKDELLERAEINLVRIQSQFKEYRKQQDEKIARYEKRIKEGEDKVVDITSIIDIIKQQENIRIFLTYKYHLTPSVAGFLEFSVNYYGRSRV